MKTQILTNFKLIWRKSLFLVFILQLVACPLWGQAVQKKELNKSDYSKWGQLQLHNVNAGGEWISYSMSYENGLDTLFVKNTATLKIFSFPKGKASAFLGKNWFAYTKGSSLHLMNLKTEEQQTISNTIKYQYVPKAGQLIVLAAQSDKSNILYSRDISGKSQHYFTGIGSFVLDQNTENILYAVTSTKENSVNLLDLKTKRITLLSSGSGIFSSLTWHSGGKAVSFILKDTNANKNNCTLFFYNLKEKKLSALKTASMQHFIGDSLTVSMDNSMRISDDMSKVFFTVAIKPVIKDNTAYSGVQIWRGNAKWVYPMEEKRKAFQGSYACAWLPFENRCQLITSDSLPKFMLTGNQKYAVLSNEKKYEPYYAYEAPRDFYLLDLATGVKTLILKKHSANSTHTVPSPDGRYISYFKEGSWWIYDISKNKHTNITDKIGIPFFHNEKEHPNNSSSYPAFGWTADNNEIILSEQFDLWAAKPDGSSARRLTQGRETKTRFRIAGYSTMFTGKENYDGRIHETINLKEGVFLEAATEDGQSGYYFLDSESNKKLVISDSTHIDQLVSPPSKKVFIWREQSYDLAPQIVISKADKKSSEIIYQSNPQQKKFFWGRSKLVSYKNSKGQILQAVLYYPAQYQNDEKYPMVVYVYEKLSQNINKYINPSEYTGDGQFNITSFTSKGYFVLAPDISYEIGDVGISAADCVIAAVKEVPAKEKIMISKMGLIGHSFGGYESSFIITQTNLFSAAVAGSAATDLSSFYLTMGWNTGRPDMWRFETQQWRMGKSLFEDKAGYDRNSPIVHADSITTPLLFWTGDADMQLNWNQSIEFYLALRRLKKQHIMLLYLKEGHTLNKKENQKDLSMRIHEWFDFHLKNDKPAPWISSGLKPL